MKKILTCSENISHEYCCTVVRIGDVNPIEGSDFLGQTLVNGLSIVVRKDIVKSGDIMFYAANETALNLDFLRVTNQYELGHRELNDNYNEVESMLAKVEELKKNGNETEAAELELKVKQMVGFFNKNGRVRMIKLRGCPSMGYLFGIDSMAAFCPEIKDVNLEEMVDQDFDTVNGVLFVKVYVPPMSQHTASGNGESRRSRKANKRFAKLNRLVPGEMARHYETQQLNRTMYRISPTDKVTISTKLHGTSAIIGKIHVKEPKWDGWYTKIFNRLPKFLRFTNTIYDYVYSTRNTIINDEINPNKGVGFLGGAVQREVQKYGELFKSLNALDENTIIYGEIVGYYTNTNTTIQTLTCKKNRKKEVSYHYDYGCQPGENKLMIYRVVTILGEDLKKEWEVEDVYNFTVGLMEKYPELANCLHPIDILWNDTLVNLYPDVTVDDNWNSKVLELLKNEKRFGMEENEPMCTNALREGIVLRIFNDPMVEAFKLKCLKFLDKEAESIDNGTYFDAEVSEHYDLDEN